MHIIYDRTLVPALDLAGTNGVLGDWNDNEFSS
jgi:hypothetical protein